MATVLTSWKSIAHYMSVGVRTVQRWSAERGFPVRGTGNGHKRLVIAMTEEIDEWVRSQSLHSAETNSQSEYECEEILQKRIACLQSEILRLHTDVMRMRKEIDENLCESSEDVLARSARLLELSSLLQQECHDVVDRCRSMRGWRANGSALTLSLLNGTYPKQKTSTRAGKNKHLGINPVFLNKDQTAAPAVLRAYASPPMELDPEYPDSADVAPDQLNAAPSAR